MDPRDDSVSVTTRIHPMGFVVVPVGVGTTYTLDLILNTGFVMTCLKPGARDSLGALGHLRATSGRFPELHDISLGGRPLPPLVVRTNVMVGRLGVDGMLGLDFLNQFRRIQFDTETLELTLTL